MATKVKKTPPNASSIKRRVPGAAALDKLRQPFAGGRLPPVRPPPPAPPIEDDGRDPALEYAVAVVDRKEVAGPYVRAACERHLRDLEEGPKRGLTWDLPAAKNILAFFPEVLRLSKGQFEGLPFVLHPSQEFIVGSLFGWKREHKKHGLVRRFTRAYVEEGKGNGKSPLAAGIGLYAMGGDNEPGAEIYVAGSNKEQSKVVFRDAVAMAKQSLLLAKRIKFAGPADNCFKMTMLEYDSTFEPVSREIRKHGSGPRPHMALIDELHEHRDKNALSTLEAGFKFRRQPLLLIMTNSGSDRTSICWQEHLNAREVALGKRQDDSTFAFVCSLDDGDDPLNDPTCWRKANPLLGITLTEEYLAEKRVKLARSIPANLNEVLRLNFCVWTDAETAWISRKAWDECQDATLRIEDFAGRRCYAGLDLSATKDFTAKALVFEDGHTDDGKPKFVAFAHAYTPADTLHARADADNVPEYHDWVRDRHVTATPGKVIRYDFVAKDLFDDSQTFDLVEVAYDRHLIKHFEDALTEIGAEFPLREHSQGFGQYKGCPPDCSLRHKHTLPDLWMPQSVKELEALILEKRIRFAINPALTSAVASAQFRTSPLGLRVFEKQKALGRIDLAVAVAMATGSAVAAATTNPSTGYVTGRLIAIH